VIIRRAVAEDAAGIAAVILPTIRDGTTYALDSNMSEADALTYWMSPEKETFVVEDNGAIVGTYYIRANQSGAESTSATAAT